MLFQLWGIYEIWINNYKYAIFNGKFKSRSGQEDFLPITMVKSFAVQSEKKVNKNRLPFFHGN